MVSKLHVVPSKRRTPPPSLTKTLTGDAPHMPITSPSGAPLADAVQLEPPWKRMTRGHSEPHVVATPANMLVTSAPHTERRLLLMFVGDATQPEPVLRRTVPASPTANKLPCTPHTPCKASVVPLASAYQRFTGA